MILCRDAEGELINPFHAVFGVETRKIKGGYLMNLNNVVLLQWEYY